IGQWDKPIIKDPTLLEDADYVVMESTYGDRSHKENGDIAKQFEDVINSTIERGGNVIIPTFAVERAQEIIYYIGELRNDKRIPNVPVYLDSPMAVDVTKVFRKHRNEFDDEAWARIAEGDNPLHFDNLHMARTTADSIAINELNQPAIIMSTSGMCTAGRIKHHLKRNVHRAESTILFVGYQAHGTLGRQILEGNKGEVRIHGRVRPLRCKVAQIYGFSGHGDREDLLRWLYNFKQPKRTFLTHGDEESAEALGKRIRSDKGWEVLIPHYDSTTDLS
ncbi:MAG: MBL fold metallo-hydrolase, partial [Planctomycetales bacterium]|nr:MBL fold metallo-hydrolase [Planctomycetales bacterium]